MAARTRSASRPRSSRTRPPASCSGRTTPVAPPSPAAADQGRGGPTRSRPRGSCSIASVRTTARKRDHPTRERLATLRIGTLIKNGTPTGKLITHAVADLARAEGLLLSDDEHRLLKILEQYVLWLGRYPMPLKKDSYQD